MPENSKTIKCSGKIYLQQIHKNFQNNFIWLSDIDKFIQSHHTLYKTEFPLTKYTDQRYPTSKNHYSTSLYQDLCENSMTRIFMLDLNFIYSDMQKLLPPNDISLANMPAKLPNLFEVLDSMALGDDSVEIKVEPSGNFTTIKSQCHFAPEFYATGSDGTAEVKFNNKKHSTCSHAKTPIPTKIIKTPKAYLETAKSLLPNSPDANDFDSPLYFKLLFLTGFCLLLFIFFYLSYLAIHLIKKLRHKHDLLNELLYKKQITQENQIPEMGLDINPQTKNEKPEFHQVPL